MQRHISIVLGFTIILISSNTWAGGIEVGDIGTVAIGRGTAFVARADNPSAFYYNPAGLSKSKGPNLLLVGNVIHQNVAFQRKGSGAHIKLSDNGKPDYSSPCTQADLDSLGCVYDPNMNYSNGITDPQAFEGVSLKKRFGPQPMLVFSWGGIGPLDDLALAAGVFVPPGTGTPVFGKKGSQRYVIRGANLIGAFPGVGASYAFNRYIQIGAVFLSGIGTFEQNQAIRLILHPEHLHFNENSGGDADFEFQLKDYFIPTGIIGALSHPLDWLEVGVSVRLPMVIEPKGKVRYAAPEKDMINSVLVPGRDAVTMRQFYPLMVRAGLRYIHRVFDIEVDLVWENWGRFKAEYEIDARVDDQGMVYDFAAEGEFIKNYRDTYSVRLGGDIEVWPEHIALRLGGFFASSAYPKNHETFAIDTPYAQNFGVGGGLTWHTFDFLDVNLGYLHVFQPDVNVEEGIIQQMGPTVETADGPRDFGNVVNNGVYEVSLNIFGASLEGHF
ncbi:MAG: hypothetical protein GY854_07680 [Deltaproteobacteria bacterium]|nr:hypothetical protein [Deltaproteobacteria bacterium]